MSRRQTLLSIFRRDRMPGLWLALLLLLVPFVQPLAEANAAGKPFSAVICSTFGVAGEAAIPGLADDCAACVAGQHVPILAVASVQAPVFAVLSSMASGFAQRASALEFAGHWTLKPPGHAPPFSI